MTKEQEMKATVEDFLDRVLGRMATGGKPEIYTIPREQLVSLLTGFGMGLIQNLMKDIIEMKAKRLKPTIERITEKNKTAQNEPFGDAEIINDNEEGKQS